MSNPQKTLQAIAIEPPPAEQRVQRLADFPKEGQRSTRYTLPKALQSPSPVGYRTRIAMSREEIEQTLPLLSLQRPTEFLPPKPITEQTLFEESTLGILSSRQSTNYKGHRQTTLGPEDSKELALLLRQLNPLDAPVLDNAAYTHVVFSRPYRTAFTLLLTLIGHKPLLNFFTIPLRAIKKRLWHVDDIPTIGYLQQLHIGILADCMERAAVVASSGSRKAQIHMAPFTSTQRAQQPAAVIDKIEQMCGLTRADKNDGWRVALVAQVGEVPAPQQCKLPPALARKIGANILAFRSERIQPGVNADDKAPDAYQHRQDMDVPDELTVMAGRAAYNAFSHWSGAEREHAKDLLLLERIDVLTPGGKERLREVRRMLEEITDKVIKNLPLWIDLPSGRMFSRTTARGKKAFALAGQRIYLGGLDKDAILKTGIDWELAVRAFGASSARSGLYCELMGVMDLPQDCDLLAGFCMMAGPVNQNDVGKTFFGIPDLLSKAFPNKNTTSMLVWTLKAKTIADPIGNEEQLLNPKQKGALVDLRPGPHEIIHIRQHNKLNPMRALDNTYNQERGYSDAGNFVTSPDGTEIPGNNGQPWPTQHTSKHLW